MFHDDASEWRRLGYVSGGGIYLEWIWRSDQWSYCTVSRICCEANHFHILVVALDTLLSKKQIQSTSAGTFYRTVDGASDGSSYLEFTTADGGNPFPTARAGYPLGRMER